jgi:hypothetical protein
VWNSQILVNLPATYVPRCTLINAKTLGLKHFHFPNMGVSGIPPERVRVVHHWTDELLINQDSVPDGQTARLLWEKTQQSQFLISFLHLVHNLRPDVYQW